MGRRKSSGLKINIGKWGKPKKGADIDQEYLAEQKKRMASYVVGGSNPSGQKIVKIYAKGDEYLIYDIDDPSPIESFRILIDTKEENDIEPIKGYNEVKDEFDRFKSAIYKTGADSSYKHRASHAITVAIGGDIDKSRELFKSIHEEVFSEFRERLYGRVAYFSGALVFVLLLTLISLFGYLNRSSEFVSSNAILLEYLVAISFAGYGGLLSVSIRVKELFVEKALNSLMYFTYGIERLVFSVLAGIATLTLLKGGLIFSSLTESSSKLYVFFSICFLSGFSETLIPNTLRKLENSESNK